MSMPRGQSAIADGSMSAIGRRALLAAAALLAGGLAAAAPAPPPGAAPAVSPVPSPSAQPAPGEPIVFGGHVLFRLQDRLGPITAEERARIISARVDSLAKGLLSAPVRLTVADYETTTDVMDGDRVILTVTQGDAAHLGIARKSLAEEYRRIIETAVNEYNSEYTWKSLALDALFAILTTLALVLALKAFGRFFPFLIGKLDSWRGTVIRTVRLTPTLELMTGDRLTSLLTSFARLIRFVVVGVTVGLYALLLFSFFPWTRGLSRTIADWLVAPLVVIGNTVLAYLPKLFFLLVIAVFTRYVIRFVRLIFDEIGRGALSFRGFRSEWAIPSFKIARFLIIAFAVVAAFPYLPGSESPAFRGVSLFLGLLFSLSSSSAIANVVAGVILTYTGAFRLDDRVKIADTVGDVLEKTLLVTRLRTIKNVEVTIPNSMVLGAHIINYSAMSLDKGLILHTSVTIGYDAPWRRVHELLIEAARKTKGILAEPAPFVLQTALNDFFVTYELNAYTDEPGKMMQTYSGLHENIQDAFNRGGVEIMSPHYTAMRDGNTVTIPAEQRGKGYVAPAFRVRQVEEEPRNGPRKGPGAEEA
jgi:small-conductance mechanosensitive channel